MPTNGRAPRGRALPKAAEELVRSLVGVRDAHVHVAPDGSLDTIDVIADAANAPAQLTSDVASALIAVFGISLAQGKIRVGANGNGATGGEVTATEGSQMPDRSTLGLSNGLQVRDVDAGVQGARYYCRVTIYTPTGLCWSVADAELLPGVGLDLAARVTVDAVRSSPVIGMPIQFEGVSSTLLHGQPIVVASVKVWNEDKPQVVFGAASIGAAGVEFAAANAVVNALGSSFAKITRTNRGSEGEQ